MSYRNPPAPEGFTQEGASGFEGVPTGPRNSSYISPRTTRTTSGASFPPNNMSSTRLPQTQTSAGASGRESPVASKTQTRVTTTPPRPPPTPAPVQPPLVHSQPPTASTSSAVQPTNSTKTVNKTSNQALKSRLPPSSTAVKNSRLPSPTISPAASTPPVASTSSTSNDVAKSRPGSRLPTPSSARVVETVVDPLNALADKLGRDISKFVEASRGVASSSELDAAIPADLAKATFARARDSTISSFTNLLFVSSGVELNGNATLESVTEGEVGDLRRALSEERLKREALEVKVDELIASGSLREGKGKEKELDLIGSDDEGFTPEQLKAFEGLLNVQGKRWMARVDRAAEKFEKRAREAARVSALDSLYTVMEDRKGEVGMVLQTTMFEVVEDYYRCRFDSLWTLEGRRFQTLEELQQEVKQGNHPPGQHQLNQQQQQQQQQPQQQQELQYQEQRERDHTSQRILAAAAGLPLPRYPPNQRPIVNQAHSPPPAKFAPQTPMHPSTIPPRTPMHPSASNPPPRTPMHRANSPPDPKSSSHLTTADHARELGLTEDMLRKYRVYFVDSNSLDAYVKTLLAPLKNRISILEKRANRVTSEEAADDAGVKVKRTKFSENTAEGEGMEVVIATAGGRDMSSNAEGGVTREELKNILNTLEDKITRKVEAELVEMPLVKQRFDQANDKMGMLERLVSGSDSHMREVMSSKASIEDLRALSRANTVQPMDTEAIANTIQKELVSVRARNDVTSTSLEQLHTSVDQHSKSVLVALADIRDQFEDYDLTFESKFTTLERSQTSLIQKVLKDTQFVNDALVPLVEDEVSARLRGSAFEGSALVVVRKVCEMRVKEVEEKFAALENERSLFLQRVNRIDSLAPLVQQLAQKTTSYEQARKETHEYIMSRDLKVDGIVEELMRFMQHVKPAKSGGLTNGDVNGNGNGGS